MHVVLENWMRRTALGLVLGISLGGAGLPAQPAEAPPAPAAPEAPLRDLTASEPPPAAETPPAAVEATEADQPPVAPAPAREPRRVNRRIVHERVMFGGASVVRADESASEAVSFGGRTRVEGEVRHSAVAILGPVTVARGARVGGEAVSVLGGSHIEGEVEHESVTVLGDAYIDAEVGGEVVVVGGSLTLGPAAHVRGDVVVVGGTLERDPAARIDGGVEHPVEWEGFHWQGIHAFFDHCVRWGRPLAVAPHLGWIWIIAGLHLLFYLVVAALFPGAVTRCAAVMEERPGRTLLASVLTAIAVPLLAVLLTLTGIGVVVVPFLALGALAAGLFGRVAVHAWLGRRITRFLPETAGSSAVMAVLLGGGLITLIYLVPFLGLLMWKLFGLLGLGMVTYTLLLAARQRRPATPPAGGGGATPFPSVPPSGPVPPAPAVSPGFGGAAAASATGASVVTLAPASSPGATFDPVIVPPAPLATGPVDAPAPIVPPVGFVATEASALPPSPGPSAAADAGFVPPPVPPPIPPPVSPPPPPLRPSASAVPLVASTLPRAGFGVRLGALLIDLVLVAVVSSFIDSVLPDEADSVPLWMGVYCFLLWAKKGTTIGGIICGLKVVRLDDRPVDWTVSLVRTLGAYLSVVCLGLGFFWLLFDEQQQTWHDKIAGTIVVRMPKGVPLV